MDHVIKLTEIRNDEDWSLEALRELAARMRRVAESAEASAYKRELQLREEAKKSRKDL